MKQDSQTYNTFGQWDDMDFPETSISTAVLEASLRYREWYLPNEIVGVNNEREEQIEAGEKGYIDVGYYEKKNTFDKDLIIENAFVRRKRAKSC